MQTVRAIEWDPTRPTALLIPVARKEDAVVHTLYAGTGTGCNAHELSALVKLVQAHEKFQELPTRKADAVKDLFQEYRSAISACIEEWQEACNETEEQDVINLELLKMNYAVLHLSDIFLPLLPSTNLSSLSSLMSLRDPYTVPGLTTADTIRYFRYNHMRDIHHEFPEYSEMMSATQPERFEGDLYWKVMTKLVMQGALEEAWNVLSKHSLYTAATAVRDENVQSLDREYIRTMRDIEQSFLVMRDLLLLAPLPGGRTIVYDNDFELPERIDEISAAILDDLDIQPLDYQYWEPRIKAGSYGDLPIEFEADAAKRKHKIWQDYVKNVAHAPSFSLPRHLPEIAPILSILSGNIREAPCDSWHEALVVELLYRQPDLRPKNLSSRARHVAREFNAQAGLSDIEEALLNVMEGNAGEALGLLFEYGAGTGAALPAVLMALLCSLFVDSAILGEAVSDRRIDFLCEAADAIQSSLSGTENQDIGVQLSLRLLLPYALEVGERGEIIRSLIAEILEHYAPSTERYARAIVSLVRPLVEKKSIQLLDATSTMLLSLYRQFMETYDFQAAVLVLLDGLELEKLVLPDRELGSCHRTLSVLCIDTAEKILSLVFETDEEKVTQLADAKVVGEAMTGAFVSQVNDVPEAMLLARSMELVASLDNRERDETNDLILRIFQEDVDRGVGGTVLRNLHWHVLRIAQHALDHHPTATFDTKCISILMERFLQLSQYAELTKSNILDQDTVASIETALANGLAKAFIAENARKEPQVEEYRAFGQEFGINTSNLHNYSLDVQQRFVEELLDS